MSVSDSKTEARYLLRRYLSRFYRAKQKQQTLRERKSRLAAELRALNRDDPDGLDDAEGRQSRIAKTLNEIESRIERQIGAATGSVTEIMAVFDLLPDDSQERDILELRHIDCLSWEEITERVHMTRTPCYLKYTRGLDLLLEREEVKEALTAYAARLAEGKCESSENRKS